MISLVISFMVPSCFSGSDLPLAWTRVMVAHIRRFSANVGASKGFLL
jgi:hypothetical protein